MTTAAPGERSGTAASDLTRWGIAGTLLLAEYLFVSFRFDAATVAQRGDLWEFIGSVGALAPLGVVAATAVLVLRGSRPGVAPEPARTGRPALWLLGLHALLFGGFWALTSLVFGGADAPAGPAALWIALWAAVGAASAITLLVGLLGAGTVRSVLSTSVLLGLGVGVAAWVAGLLTTALWEPLTHATFALVVTLLRTWFPEVVAIPRDSAVELGDFGITIAPICSGLEGVGLVTVLMLGLLVAFRQDLRFPHALLLLPIGIVGVWLANGVRVALLLVIGAHWDADIALGGFHSKAGWVFFCAIALGLATLGRRARFFAKSAEQEAVENPTAPFLMPALVVIATGLVTGMLSSGVDHLYWVRVVAAAAALYAYRAHYRDLDRHWHVGSLLAGVAVGALWLVTAPKPPPDAADVSLFWIVMRIVGSALVIPICEELAFRGFLLRRLVAEDFRSVPFSHWTPVAALGSSLAFAFVHERWALAFVTGLVFAAAQVRSGRLMDAIVAHAASNVVICAWVLLTGERWHW